jgi:hypothetical protein
MQTNEAAVTAQPDHLDIVGETVPMPTSDDTMSIDGEDLSSIQAEEVLAAAEGSERPADVPEKFWDPDAGSIRTDALLRSYLELERRLGRSVPKPEGEDDVEGIERLLGILGRPAAADGYEIDPPHPLLAPDPSLNEMLHAAGFTQRQAQLVYNLAAERLLPVIDEASGELEALRQIDRLERHFGGPEAWRTTAAQIKAYAEANLPEELFGALAGSYEGVLALHEMMRKAEPEIVGQAGSGQLAITEDSLRELIRDPRYWRDRDPEIVQRVTAGYRSLYPG